MKETLSPVKLIGPKVFFFHDLAELIKQHHCRPEPFVLFQWNVSFLDTFQLLMFCTAGTSLCQCVRDGLLLETQELKVEVCAWVWKNVFLMYLSCLQRVSGEEWECSSVYLLLFSLSFVCIPPLHFF